MDEVCEVIITAPDPDWLIEFTRSLVADRLCAAGHNFAPVRSIYRWRGEIYDRAEGRVALHTRRDLVPQIIERTNRDHPYEVPCVITLPITSGDREYLNWILAETAERE
ncbi:divalent-cation tolerance protein CutA [Streptosporangium sp. NPDC006007]|uniref:divalent-cation tolerance protein CutA n=1 Tax=Streptosporangium sp. NPDC006007 TaxID=3154575 RepID=UPI0033A5BD1E